MNKNNRKVPIAFGPETTFDPVPVAPFRAALESAFERLKLRLLSARLEELADPVLNSQLRRASNEAETLAWLTPYPLLVFPALFDERAEAAGAYTDLPSGENDLSPRLVPV